MSTFFTNAQKFSISGGTFSCVRRDQHNYYNGRTTIETVASSSANRRIAANQEASSSSTATPMVVHVNGDQVNQFIQREEMEHTEFDDYRKVKSGDFYRLEDVCVVKIRRGWQNVDKTICAVKVIGTEGRFTSVTYSGPDARSALEEDFRKCSRARSANHTQAFAVDIGKIPSLLLWHGLVPFSHFERGLGAFGPLYLWNLTCKIHCKGLEELWVDSTRGEICLGPEGPESGIEWDGWDFEMENLPLTSELLQEDVFMRFLASQESKEADQVFVWAICGRSEHDVNVPESCHRPTIFSTLTATPIAFANNVWTSNESFVERKVLENGLTRFRLDGSEDYFGRFRLELNEYAELAWLCQSSNIFHSRGIVLEEDLSAYRASSFVFPLSLANIDQSSSIPGCCCQATLTKPLPHPNDDASSRSTFSSIHFPATPSVSKPRVFTSGLSTKMVNIDFHPSHVATSAFPFNSVLGFGRSSQCPGPPAATSRFVNITLSEALTQQLPVLLDTLDMVTMTFNPSTTQTDSWRLIKVCPSSFVRSNSYLGAEHSDSLDGSVIGNDSECLLHTIDQKLAEDPVCMASNQAGRESAINSICATNKRRKMDMGFGGAERNNPEPKLRHKNDTADDRDLAIDGQASRPVQPLPSRFSPFADPVNPYPQDHSHPHSGYQSQVAPPCYHNNQPPYHYPSHPAGPLSGDVLPASCGMNMPFPTTSNLSFSHLQPRGWPNLSQNTAAATYFDALPPSNAYSSAEIANSASDLTTSMMDLNYTPPSVYAGVNAVADAPRYNIGADQSTGWLGPSLVQTSGTVNTFYDGPAHPSTSYSTPALTYPSDSAHPVDLTYPSYSVVPTPHVHDPGYPSPFSSYGGGSLVPQQHWNPPVVHHDPSYTAPSFSPPGVTHYPPNSTVHAQAHFPLPAYAAQEYLPMLPSNGGGSHVLHQPWNTPADYPQQYTYDPAMKSTQRTTWNETSGESGEGDGALGWQRTV
ncbi:hypothetical protein PM082_006331 [Marasmius tenuissimus]|nr:hypothetical protein PM082_006331 [Marasmius tenuissimus]